MMMSRVQQKFRLRAFFTVSALSAETSAFDILKKFPRYGKMKTTFRGSNLAKESFHKLYICLRYNLDPYLVLSNKQGQKIDQITSFSAQFSVAGRNFEAPKIIKFENRLPQVSNAPKNFSLTQLPAHMKTSVKLNNFQKVFPNCPSSYSHLTLKMI